MYNESYIYAAVSWPALILICWWLCGLRSLFMRKTRRNPDVPVK